VLNTYAVTKQKKASGTYNKITNRNPPLIEEYLVVFAMLEDGMATSDFYAATNVCCLWTERPFFNLKKTKFNAQKKCFVLPLCWISFHRSSYQQHQKFVPTEHTTLKPKLAVQTHQMNSTSGDTFCCKLNLTCFNLVAFVFRIRKGYSILFVSYKYAKLNDVLQFFNVIYSWK